MGFFQRLVNGLKNTKKSFGEKLKYIFTGNEIDEDFFDELEMVLISADIGVSTTEEILDRLREEIKKNKIKKTEDSKKLLKQILVELLEENELSNLNYPLAILIVGVNGVGKTTTIGKLAQKFTEKHKKVVIAGADTFRAAAGDQLKVWADRVKAKYVAGEQGADASAVVFDAIASSKAKGADVLLIDTAGRLHNKANLMEELKKIGKVVAREYPEADYHKLIVVDGTTGQNSLQQVALFDEAVGLTDMVVTKLDGTSKAGFIVELASTKPEIGMRYIGVGETADDLLEFNAKEFVDAIFE
ncbi:MAG: signal recognition particle-docking protein FtsY [Clostridia bacterium]|nr:signal recognition particle-docking protein FtsY [Clostridia bacterium]